MTFGDDGSHCNNLKFHFSTNFNCILATMEPCFEPKPDCGTWFELVLFHKDQFGT